jgi:hypothetical protein
MKNLYRKDKFGKIIEVGHLLLDGSIDFYCDILNREETEEERNLSYNNLLIKTDLGLFEPLVEKKLIDRYLVQEVKDYFDNIILTNVLEVLQLVESNYGTIVIIKHDTDEGWSIDPLFLNQILEDGYIFSDDEKYKEHLTWEN